MYLQHNLNTRRQIVKDGLKEKVLSGCKNQKHYVDRMLNNLLEKSKENASIMTDYITAEQNEISIREQTKEIRKFWRTCQIFKP